MVSEHNKWVESDFLWTKTIGILSYVSIKDVILALVCVIGVDAILESCFCRFILVYVGLC